MLWQNLTVPALARAAVETGGVCLLPIGVMEAHARHLPLGTDAFACFETAKRAADLEPAVVLPMNFWGFNYESMHRAGAIAIDVDLVTKLLHNICDEVSRNGFKKIIIVSGHGGNRFLLGLFIQSLVARDVEYVAYAYTGPRSDELQEAREELLEEKETGHACEWETSVALHLFGDCVDMSALSAEPFRNMKRNESLQKAGLYSPVDWYAMYPTMQVGHAKAATAEKGKRFVDIEVKQLAAAIRAVKDDDVTPALMREFFDKTKEPTSGWETGGAPAR
jgi:creatinine amidohydrolase